MESLQRAYMRLISDMNVDDRIKQEKDRMLHMAALKKIPAEIYMEQHQERLVNIYKEVDLAAICDLMEMGYTWRDVMENYTSMPLIMQEYDDPVKIKQYTDEVISKVNEERHKRAKNDFVGASDAYNRIKKNLSKKYVEENDQQFREYHDGEIVIAMLMEEGYPEKTVKDVLRNNTDYDEIYIKSLLEKCMEVKKAYMDIASALPLENVRNEYDVYRSFAREHMAKLGIKTLSYNDDLAIFAQLKNVKLPEDYIRQAIMKASPVANEPGRDKAAYVDAVLSGDNKHSEFLEGRNRQPVEDTEQVYKALIESYNKELLDKGITGGIREGVNRAYFDVLAAKKLFYKHHSEQDIISILTKFSPEGAAQASSGYTQWVIEKAKRLIAKEEYVLNKSRIQLPEGDYLAVTSGGISPKDIVISLLQERLRLNPSLSQSLHKSFVDRDVAESVLSRYPDFDIEALKGTLADFPRAIILSGSKMAEERDYVDNVIKAVQKRIHSQNKKLQENEQMKEAFRQEQDMLSQGMAGETASMKMSIYHVGRAALSMMKNNTDEMELRRMIISNVDAKEGEIEAITNNIIRQNREVLARIKNIDACTAEAITSDCPPEAFYLNRLAVQHKLRKSINASMDPEIVKDMLAAKVYSKNEIKEAVEALSPIAAQPGRGRDYYLDYVYPTAVSLLRSEKEKLKTYHPIPRVQKEDDTEKEYNYHKEQLMASIALPFEAAMDTLIAETMLLQGYPAYDIARALDEYSPCHDIQENYGLSIIKRVENVTAKLAADKEDVEETHAGDILDKGRILSRNITEALTQPAEGGN